jgi:drug/metabolite transporter (DMT)-like permease
VPTTGESRSSSSNRRGALLSLASTALGAAYLVPYKLAGGLASPAAVIVVMLASAAGFNTAIALAHRRGRIRIHRIELAVSVVLAVCTVIGNVAVLLSLRTLQPAITSVATHTQIFFVVALAWPLLGERPNRRFTLGVMVAAAGFAVMRLRGAGDAAVSLEGLAWALTAAASWATMQVVTRRYSARLEPVVVNALRLWIATAALARFPGTVGEVAVAPAAAWLYASAAAFLGPFLSRVLLMYSVQTLTASRSSLVGLVGPVFAFVFALLAFGDVPTGYEIAGGIVIIAGVALPMLGAG